eukprot:363925-Chlamydomonas_euryale.AAC.11
MKEGKATEKKTRQETREARLEPSLPPPHFGSPSKRSAAAQDRKPYYFWECGSGAHVIDCAYVPMPAPTMDLQDDTTDNAEHSQRKR